jgi:hypothetical protein
MVKKMSPAVFDVKCKGCLFYDLCVGVKLPHCTGLDYVERKDKKEGE